MHFKLIIASGCEEFDAYDRTCKGRAETRMKLANLVERSELLQPCRAANKDQTTVLQATASSNEVGRTNPT